MLQTQTVDIDHVKTVLENSPHFESIIHYEYPYGDILSKRLIDWYRDLIFSANAKDEKQVALIRALDRSLYLYVRDNKYKRELRKVISADELTFESKECIKNVVKLLIEFTGNYENNEVREVSVSKWL